MLEVNDIMTSTSSGKLWKCLLIWSSARNRWDADIVDTYFHASRFRHNTTKHTRFPTTWRNSLKDLSEHCRLDAFVIFGSSKAINSVMECKCVLLLHHTRCNLQSRFTLTYLWFLALYGYSLWCSLWGWPQRDSVFLSSMPHDYVKGTLAYLLPSYWCTCLSG